MEEKCARISDFGAFELTHPELLSETELRMILKNICIDFSKYEKLCRSELIEMYKQIAMPLPQRTRHDIANSSLNNEEEGSTSTVHPENSEAQSSKPCSLKRSFSETKKVSLTSIDSNSKSPTNDAKDVMKKVCMNSPKSESECNGTEKRVGDQKNEEAPPKKRQKITWP